MRMALGGAEPSAMTLDTEFRRRGCSVPGAATERRLAHRGGRERLMLAGNHEQPRPGRG